MAMAGLPAWLRLPVSRRLPVLPALLVWLAWLLPAGCTGTAVQTFTDPRLPPLRAMGFRLAVVPFAVSAPTDGFLASSLAPVGEMLALELPGAAVPDRTALAMLMRQQVVTWLRQGAFAFQRTVLGAPAITLAIVGCGAIWSMATAWARLTSRTRVVPWAPATWRSTWHRPNARCPGDCRNDTLCTFAHGCTVRRSTSQPDSVTTTRSSAP